MCLEAQPRKQHDNMTSKLSRWSTMPPLLATIQTLVFQTLVGRTLMFETCHATLLAKRFFYDVWYTHTHGAAEFSPAIIHSPFNQQWIIANTRTTNNNTTITTTTITVTTTSTTTTATTASNSP
ncbi:hypothetical protein VaNZ11_005196 [Volvox africanus]|uniref:Uncharacterized protein n=1 Tax=Volvox africanus TaxID=51714 RepID=A0ABQ5RY35_9CHLO|nr:hypothetical protein VaNZ11_005196 [Volvox africanus]